VFDQLIESTGKHDKTKKPLTFTISIIVHVVVVVVLIIVPLLFPETLSGQLSALTQLIAPPPPPPPAPPPPPPTAVVRVQRVQVDDGQFRAPVQIPKEIAKIVDEGPPPDSQVGGVVGGVPGGVPGGTVGGVLGGVIGGANQGPIAPPPPPPPPEAPKPPQRIRVGGNVQQANLVRQVKPPYPPLARQARIQGAVILEAIISRQGRVDQLRVISGHPLLVQAALDAVRQWQYRPTLLNGEPVEVVTTITVNFNLSGG
jgi:periplasmic protein TonB